MARTGRRKGNPDTREAILRAARQSFAERGYDGVTVRAIATAADVDPALVHHYFGTKEQLFVATVEAPFDPAQLLPEILAGGVDGLGERIVTTFLRVWDSPAGTAAAALLRTAVNNEWTTRLIREFLVSQILRRAATALGYDQPDAALRVSLVGSQMVGLAMARYILKLEPLASTDPAVIIAATAPNVQHYLTGDLSGKV